MDVRFVETTNGRRSRGTAGLKTSRVTGGVDGHAASFSYAGRCSGRSRKRLEPVRSGASGQWDRRRGGNDGDQCARDGVEEEVVAGGDDHEQHEGRIERSNRAHERAASLEEQGDADDQCVADVHAGNGGVGVVERADDPLVEVDVAVRDGVGDADPRQPRRCGRVREEPDEGKCAGEEERGANEREGSGASLVQPEQHRHGDGEVEGQVGGAEQAGHTRQGARGVLHVRFEEDVEPPLERDDSVGVVIGFACVTYDETPGELVKAVHAEHGGCFAPQRVPGGQPPPDAGGAVRRERRDVRNGWSCLRHGREAIG